MSCYRGDEVPGSDCPECNEELCPKPGDECPQGLVPDICGCCPQGLCGLSEGKKCFNASLSRVLPAESRKYGVCGANLHCLLRSDLRLRVSDLYRIRAVMRSLSVGGPRLIACRSAGSDFMSDDSCFELILPVVLYGCETWSLTLREERRLRVFENRALRRVFGSKRDEVTGEWRKLHNEELSNLYSLPNIMRVVKSRRMRWAGHVARMGQGRGVHRVLVGKHEGKRPLGRPRRRWEDNIKTDL